MKDALDLVSTSLLSVRFDMALTIFVNVVHLFLEGKEVEGVKAVAHRLKVSHHGLRSDLSVEVLG